MWKKQYEENRRKKMESDPEYKDRVKNQRSRTPEENREYMKKYYQKNKHRWKKRTREQQDEINAKRRELYATDPEYRKSHIASVKEGRIKYPKTRLAQVLRKYGLTIKQYERMLKKQKGRCAVCKRKDSGDRRGHRMHVDHCHDTGVVRGLLCSNCNMGIGKFGDDPERLEIAAAYLRKTKPDKT